MHPPLQYPTNTFPILKLLLPIYLSCPPRSSQPTPLFFKSPVCCRLLPSGLIFQSPSSSGVHGSAETVADRQCRELERELALLWAPAAALGQPDCALAPSSLSLVPMISSSLPRGLPAGADSRSIIAADLVLGFGCSFFSQDPPGCSDRVAASQPQESWNLASNQVCLGPIFRISSPRWQASALAQGTEPQLCVLVSDFLKDTRTDSPFFRWQGIHRASQGTQQKWVFPCTPVSRPRPATKSFPTAWLRQSLPFLRRLGKGFLAGHHGHP